MAKFTMDDGTVVDTDKASATWNEDSQWDGRNHISVPTGSQWSHETLFRSRKGRYYLVHSSAYQGSTDTAEFVDNEVAVRWLLVNGRDVPADLQSLVDDVIE